MLVVGGGGGGGGGGNVRHLSSLSSLVLVEVSRPEEEVSLLTDLP